jgi:hypothetical protein
MLLFTAYIAPLNRKKSDSTAAMLGSTVARPPETSRRSVTFYPSKFQASSNVEQALYLSRQAFQGLRFLICQHQILIEAVP